LKSKFQILSPEASRQFARAGASCYNKTNSRNRRFDAMIFTTQSGQSVGPIGQGTWYLGEDPSLFPEEYKALRTGVEAGMNRYRRNVR
jgi:hypothetical protein